MKIYLAIIGSTIFTLTACLDLASGVTSEELIASYNVPNKDFHIDISNVGGGATSADFMQIRRIYKDSTGEVVNNIANRDSVVSFKCYSDTIHLIVRGRQWDVSIKNDTFKFSINNTWTPGRFKINH